MLWTTATLQAQRELQRVAAEGLRFMYGAYIVLASTSHVADKGALAHCLKLFAKLLDRAKRSATRPLSLSSTGSGSVHILVCCGLALQPTCPWHCCNECVRWLPTECIVKCR